MDNLLQIHANVFALPASAKAGPQVLLRGQQLPTLTGTEEGPPVFDAALQVTFEQMQTKLMEIDRSDCEPDGFFLVTGGQGKSFWRLNGHMHEASLGTGPRTMHRVELNGQCPASALDAVLRSMGWPDADLVFELVMEGVTLNEQAFRVWAQSEKLKE